MGIQSVCAGGAHSLAVSLEGEVWGWGLNTMNQLGRGPDVVWKPLVIAQEVEGCAAGLAHTFLVAKGKVRGAGWNSSGQVGVGHLDNVVEFTPLEGLPKVTYVSCGAAHSVFVAEGVWSTGANSCGQLGLGHNEDVSLPSLVTANISETEISISRCGEEFTILISTANEVFGCGLGNVGQMGDARNSMFNVPTLIREMEPRLGAEEVACTKSQVLAITRNGQTYSWGISSSFSETKPRPPTLIPALKAKEVKTIACLRDSFVIALKHPEQRYCYASGIPLKPLTAGKKHLVSLTLVNNDRQFITSPGDRVTAVCFDEETGTNSEGQVGVYYDISRYIIEITANKAGNHKVYVFVNSLEIANSPFLISVAAAKLAYCKAYLPLNSIRQQENKLVLYAGGAVVITLEGYDRFGNSCEDSNELEKSDIEITGTRVEYSLVERENGIYKVSVKCLEAGEKRLYLKAKGTLVEVVYQDLVIQEDQQIQIVDAYKTEAIDLIVLPAVYSETFVRGLKDSYRAGETVSFDLVNLDEYGNRTWFAEDLDLNITRYGSNISFEQEKSPSSTYTTFFFKAEKSGVYKVAANYQNKNVVTRVFSVEPDTACKATWEGNGLQSCAFTDPPVQKFIYFKFYDQFGNPTNSENFSFQVSDSENTSFEIHAAEYGVEVTYQVYKQGTYQVNCCFGNLAVPGFPAEVSFEEHQRAQETPTPEEVPVVQTLSNSQNKEDIIEAEKRKRIMERIRNQEVVRKRAQQALMDLYKSKANKEPKKWKRTGGGFVVPFENK